MKAISYPFRIDAHGAVASTTDSRRIWMDRVRAVLNTEVGDRAMRPSFGIDSNSAILNMGTPASEDFITGIREAFARLLPALTLNSVTPDLDADSGVLTVDVVFTCPDRTVASTSVTFDGGNVTSETDPYEVFSL